MPAKSIYKVEINSTSDIKDVPKKELTFKMLADSTAKKTNKKKKNENEAVKAELIESGPIKTTLATRLEYFRAIFKTMTSNKESSKLTPEMKALMNDAIQQADIAIAEIRNMNKFFEYMHREETKRLKKVPPKLILYSRPTQLYLDIIGSNLEDREKNPISIVDVDTPHVKKELVANLKAKLIKNKVNIVKVEEINNKGNKITKEKVILCDLNKPTTDPINFMLPILEHNKPNWLPSKLSGKLKLPINLVQTIRGELIDVSLDERIEINIPTKRFQDWLKRTGYSTDKGIEVIKAYHIKNMKRNKTVKGDDDDLELDESDEDEETESHTDVSDEEEDEEEEIPTPVIKPTIKPTIAPKVQVKVPNTTVSSPITAPNRRKPASRA